MTTGRKEFFEAGSREQLRLGRFIREDAAQIVQEWTRFAGTRTPASEGMTTLALKDHVDEILDFIATDLESAQTSSEQLQKSRGDGPKAGGAQQSAAEVHADLRLNDGFDVDQMVSEYRALRACVVKLWSTRKREWDRDDFDDLVRFNEAIDQAMMESLSHYTQTIDQSRNLFLGILGHDLRNPIAAILISADRLADLGPLNAQQAAVVNGIHNSVLRSVEILDDLLDLTRVQFGSDLPIHSDKMDMAVLSEQLVDEMRAAHPHQVIILKTVGNLEGEWDRLRLGQVLSNLIGNAIVYGFKDFPVEVSVEGGPEEVVLSVRNMGAPIPQERMRSIFEAHIRGDQDRQKPKGSTHMGLGLYITQKIVGAHGGTIGVTSSERDGTRFTVSLPRHHPAASNVTRR